MPEDSSARLEALVAQWLRLDRVESLASSGDHAELLKLFEPRISFGTAGLRSRMQAGYASINDLVVLQASVGLAVYAERHVSRAQERGVVVGFDHRATSDESMSSAGFAALCASAFRKRGWKVYKFDGLVHTPMVPFAVKQLGAAVGVMVTASHNPAQDNGYKVYWDNAVQIVPPHDAGISKAIEESLEIDAELWDTSDESAWSGSQAIKDDYFEWATSLCSSKAVNSDSDLSFAYTAMHGVGLPFAQRMFELFGFRAGQLNIVSEQARPDPEFPTVKFPNPEEKGALDLAISYADRTNSSIVLANDPDADRFCVAEKQRDSGRWQVFTGDQIGTLLGAWAFEKYKRSGKPVNKLAVCASTVSSKMLRAMAKVEGFEFRDTLTGFKYLGNEALKLEKQGFDPVFEYEEAIGYAHGTLRDKDGVTALACFCELAASLRKTGIACSDYLESLYDKYGFFASSNSYFVCRDTAKINRIFSQLRFGTDSPPQHDALTQLRLPQALGGYPINYIRDLTVGYDSSNPPSFEPNLPVDPKTHMISFAVGPSATGNDDVEVTGTVRTSGTEPKIKFYLEGSGHDRTAVNEKLARVREALGEEWLKWRENQLEKP